MVDVNESEFDFLGGEVAYWDMAHLSDSDPLSDQEGSLKEDLAQVVYGDLILDVGWYFGRGGSGSFVVCVVMEENWDAPLFSAECASLVELRGRISEGARFAASLGG